MSSLRIRFISPSGKINTFPRLIKLIRLFQDMGFSVELLYWDRDGKTDTSDLNIKAIPILRGGGYSNHIVKLYYISYVIKLVLVSIVNKRQIIYSVGTVSTLPFAFANLFGGAKFIFDNNDNLSLSHKWPAPIGQLIALLERFIASRAFLHVVPSRRRWQYNDLNLRILPNVPSLDLLNRAKAIAKAKGYSRDGRFTVYVNGLMTKTRGWEMIVKTMLDESVSDIQFIIAGVLTDYQLQEIEAAPNIQYLGAVSSESALSIYYKSHIALTFYDPSIAINRIAEPTKWGDCVATATPFIGNYGIETISTFVDSGVCICINYDSHIELVEVLLRISRDKNWKNAVENSFNSIRFNYWEEAAKIVFKPLGELNE